jgi:hypothetical protein
MSSVIISFVKLIIQNLVDMNKTIAEIGNNQSNSYALRSLMKYLKEKCDKLNEIDDFLYLKE